MNLDESPHPTRHRITKSLLIAATGLFITAAALAVVKPPEAPLPAYVALQTLELSPIHARSADITPAPFIAETRIRRGDTMAAVLQRLKVDDPGLQPFLVQNKDARSIYKLYPGRVVQAALDDRGALVWLRYKHTPGTQDSDGFVSKWLEVRPDGSGDFTATEHRTPAEVEVRIAEGNITSSLFGAADSADIPDAITIEMVDILSSKIDFVKDLRQGDKFRVVYDAYTHEGREVGTGKIRALEFLNRGQTYSAVWYAPDNDQGAYYDFAGNSLKGAFLRNAIKFTRITSRFGLRKHPIHKQWRGHNGVDYAAPSGTPIRATADGTVEFIGRQNGYGNVIILRNYGNYSTLYAHQSRFAAGLRRGAKVEQGQIIGYVGSTGWATGPHLHYEFRIAKKPVDPLAVDLPVTRPLEPAQRKAFQSVVAQYQTHIDFLARIQDTKQDLAQR
ncbi:M23 family metallopeptidase [Alcaligenaceae bacterium CGII-47]|nr:M23 family metallopeptidase [Alcaligenaceae bacterium CGII-47]